MRRSRWRRPGGRPRVLEEAPQEGTDALEADREVGGEVQESVPETGEGDAEVRRSTKSAAKRKSADRQANDDRRANRVAPTSAATAPPVPPKPRPNRVSRESAAKKSPLTPPLPNPQPATPTMIELRQRAKAQQISGYSRLNKAELIAALEASRRA